MATMKRILFDPTPRLPETIPGVGSSLHGILERALAKDVADRYQTAAEFAAALEQTLVPEPVARPKPVQPVPAEPVRETPAAEVEPEQYEASELNVAAMMHDAPPERSIIARPPQAADSDEISPTVYAVVFGGLAILVVVLIIFLSSK